MLLLSPAALPAVPPIADEKLKTEGIYFQTGLKADAKVAVIHLILVDVSMQKTEMACYGEKQVVIPRW